MGTGEDGGEGHRQKEDEEGKKDGTGVSCTERGRRKKGRRSREKKRKEDTTTVDKNEGS